MPEKTDISVFEHSPVFIHVFAPHSHDPQGLTGLRGFLFAALSIVARFPPTGGIPCNVYKLKMGA